MVVPGLVLSYKIGYVSEWDSQCSIISSFNEKYGQIFEIGKSVFFFVYDNILIKNGGRKA